MRRFCKRGLPVALFVIIALLYPLLAPPPHRIDQTHFERISRGMSREQVEVIFGVPAGEYDWAKPGGGAEFTTHANLAAREMELAARELYAIVEMSKNGESREFIRNGPCHSVISVWTSLGGIFVVSFDEHDRVVAATMSPEVRIVPPWQRWCRSWKK